MLALLHTFLILIFFTYICRLNSDEAVIMNSIRTELEMQVKNAERGPKLKKCLKIWDSLSQFIYTHIFVDLPTSAPYVN